MVHFTSSGSAKRRQSNAGEAAQSAEAAATAVVVVIEHPCLVALPDEGGVAEEKRAAADGEVVAVGIKVGAGDFSAAADADFISAFRAPAAQTSVDEEVIKATVLEQGGSLNGLVPRDRRCR